MNGAQALFEALTDAGLRGITLFFVGLTMITGGSAVRSPVNKHH